MTTAPSETISAVTNFGRPIATTRISARRVTSARFLVRLWAIVTVAFWSKRSFDTGRPTMFERPITTASLPAISTPAVWSIRIMPFGVQGSVQGCFCQRAATLAGWKPSTSFFTSMAAITLSSEICFGSGSCTRIPSTSSSAFSSAIRASSSSSVMVASRRIVEFLIPTSADAFALPVTYDTLAGLSPTKITARCGTRPYFSGKVLTSSAIAAFILADSSLPLIIISLSRYLSNT